MSKANVLYLIVRNRGNYAAIYCASSGLEGRIRQGHMQYYGPDSEVFVIGSAADSIPVGLFVRLDPMPMYLLEHLRGIESGGSGETLSLDLPGMRKPKRKGKAQ